MPKKLTYDFVKGEFERRGFTLLSSSYKNNHTKLRYMCKNGHTHSIKFCHFKDGIGCPYCVGVGIPTIEELRSSFKKEGYLLLSDTYVNNKTKLYYVCPKGHKHHIVWADWKNGHRCAYCTGRARLNIEDIKSAFALEGYKLVSTTYTNAKGKLDYECPYGHKHSINWNDWKTGYRCPTCAYINNSGENSPNWRGGKSFEEYCAVWQDQEYKQDIRERDGNCCLNPYCNSKNPNDLTIHHINYDKKDCHPKNLITVCRSCNSKANVNRKWHKAWYQAIMYKRYNYVA